MSSVYVCVISRNPARTVQTVVARRRCSGVCVCACVCVCVFVSCCVLVPLILRSAIGCHQGIAKIRNRTAGCVFTGNV
jgi:hypothetical protein